MKITKVNLSEKRGGVVKWLLFFWCPESRQRIRRRFDSEKEAKQFFQEHQRRRSRGIPASILHASAGALADVVVAMELAEKGGFTLSEAARVFAGKRQQDEALAMMPGRAELEAAFLASKKADGCRAATVQSYASMLGSLHLRLKEKPLHQLSTGELRALFERMAGQVRAVSVNNWRRHAHVFFEWLRAKGYRADNPCSDVPIVRLQRADPCIYSADEAERLMRAVEKVAPQYARAYALALFTGIRPKGIERLTEVDILLDEKLVRVGWGQDKTGQKYFAPIPANAHAWLIRYAEKQQLVVTRHEREKVLEVAELRHGHDILRHTFASHHLAAHASADMTAHALNHRGVDMLFRHYRAAVKPADGVRFFSILPSAT